jgi:hypothetical protein
LTNESNFFIFINVVFCQPLVAKCVSISSRKGATYSGREAMS